MRHVGTFAACGAVAVLLLAATVGSAGVSSQTQEKVDSVNRMLLKVVALSRAKDYDALGTLIDQIDTGIADLKLSSDSEELTTAVLPVMEHRLEAAQRLLKASLDMAAATAPKTVKPKGPATDLPAMPANSTVSFIKDVAPLLVDNCSKCHITKRSGGFSLATYESLLKGSENGTVFQPGKGDGSTLIESLVTGDMPRGGGKLNEIEISKIAKWIDEGARFDGPDPSVSLVELAKNGPAILAAANPTKPVTKPVTNNKPTATTSASKAPRMPGVPSPDGRISFMFDIAPVVIDRCLGCHSGRQPPGRYNVTSFASLVRGGENGDAIVPGEVKESLLMQKLHGTAEKGRRMPAKGGPLKDDVIKMFEKWIAAGAKFDGDDPRGDLEYQVQVLTAIAMSHEELASWRVVQLKKKWDVGNPGVGFGMAEDNDARIISNVTPGKLKDLEANVTAVKTKVAELLKVPAGRPFIKGKLTIYVFDKPFEQREFTKEVEKRDLPSELSSYFRFDFVDSYCSIVAPQDEKDPKFNGQLIEQMAGSYVQSLAKHVPIWFAMGTGRAAVARLDPKSPLVKEWDANMNSAEGAAANAGEFFKADALDGKGALLAYGFVRFLMQDPRYISLVRELEKGTEFDEAFNKVYGKSPLGVYQSVTRGN